jgi:hypothetical protein
VTAPQGGVAPFFKLYCQTAASCQGGTFYLYSYAEKMEGAWFNEANSGLGATLNIGSLNAGMVSKLNRIECSAFGACANMVVNLVNGEIGDFICSVPGACDGCIIQDWKDAMKLNPSNPTNPRVTPCMQVAKLEWL